MKKIFLMRHSIPEKGDMPNEQIPLSEEGKELAVSKNDRGCQGGFLAETV